MSGTSAGALADEVGSQPGILDTFARSSLRRLPAGSIFVGAGDSYAAALAGSYVSEGRCAAMDPYSLGAFPQAAAGRDVVFVSASGRTSSNVGAARRVRGRARRTWAVTADGRSPLAGEVDRVVELPMEHVKRTPGLLSFTLSLAAVLKLSSGQLSCDYSGALRRAAADSALISYGKGTTYFLGNSAAYAAAVYSAGKAYELLGAKCHPELLEEFPHMEAFSLRNDDAVNVFSGYDPAGMGEKLCRLLASQKFDAHLVPGRHGPPVEGLFRTVFAVQLATLNEMSARGISRPKFLSARRSLSVSDRMIY